MNFTLNENCNLHDELWVIVARVQKPQEESEPVIERDICTIRNLKDSCESWTSQICSCSKEKGVYTLRKTVEQSDNTTWVWRTDPEVAEVTELAFVVSVHPETKTDDSFGSTPESNTYTSPKFDRSSTISDQPHTEKHYSFRTGTERNADIKLPTGLSTSIQSDVPDVPDVHVATVKSDVSGASVPLLYGFDFMVVTSVGILALAGTVTAITVSIVCVRRSRRSDERRLSALVQLQPTHPLEVMRPQEDEADENNEDNEDRRFSQETDFYWEVRDDPPTPSPELPRPCLCPALPDDYLHPAVSRGVMEGTDDSTKVAPLYDNSALRQVRALGRPDQGTSHATPAVNTYPARKRELKTSLPLSSIPGSISDAGALSTAQTKGQEETEVDDTTDDSESGYMPMNRSAGPTTSQEAAEESVFYVNS